MAREAPAVVTEADPQAQRSFLDDPYPTYARWRDVAPVVRTSDGTYFAGGYRAVHEILRDHERFSSQWPGAAAAAEDDFRVVLIADDPPRHTRLRELVSRAFTPRRVADLEPAIRDIVTERVDVFTTDGEVDFMDALGVPLPVTVIGELLGVPRDRRTRFRTWSAAVISMRRGEQEAVLVREMASFLKDAIRERRSAPVDDLINALTHAEIDGEHLTDQEVTGFAGILLVAGNESTAGLLGNMVNVLALRPELWTKLRDDRTLVEPFIEEVLRFDSPVQILTRWPTGDCEVDGIELPAGAWLSVGFGSANRDPEAFTDPDEFRIDRKDRAHVAFGAGIHYCLGAPLARLEATIALSVLLDRFDSVSYADRPAARQRASTIVRAFSELPVRFR